LTNTSRRALCVPPCRLYGDIEYLLQALRGLSSELDPGTKLITLYTSRFGQPPPPQQQKQPPAATQT
jgi:hypothetical protein